MVPIVPLLIAAGAGIITKLGSTIIREYAKAKKDLLKLQVIANIISNIAIMITIILVVNLGIRLIRSYFQGQARKPTINKFEIIGKDSRKYVKDGDTVTILMNIKGKVDTVCCLFPKAGRTIVLYDDGIHKDALSGDKLFGSDDIVINKNMKEVIVSAKGKDFFIQKRTIKILSES